MSINSQTNDVGKRYIFASNLAIGAFDYVFVRNKTSISQTDLCKLGGQRVKRGKSGTKSWTVRQNKLGLIGHAGKAHFSRLTGSVEQNFGNHIGSTDAIFASKFYGGYLKCA